MRKVFKAVENAQELGNFQLSQKPPNFDGGRVVDVIFFFHGTLHTDDKANCEPQLQRDKADLFLVPENTQLFSYNRLEDTFDDIADDEDKLKEFMISRIQLRQELVRGSAVKPTMVAQQGESSIDRPEFYMLFNKLLHGYHVNALKITVTRDIVDCGDRKIVEEVMLKKFSDYEMFSLKEVVG